MHSNCSHVICYWIIEDGLQNTVIYTHVNDKKPHVRDDITDGSIVQIIQSMTN